MKFAVSLLCLLIAAAAFCADEPQQHDYRISIDTDALTKMGDAPANKIKSTAVWEYRHLRAGDKLTIHELSDSVNMTVDGKLMRESYTSSERIMLKTPERSNDVLAKDASENIKKFLKDQFGNPVSVITLDDKGAVVKREDPVTPFATQAEKSGMAGNFMLFHGVFPDADEWDEDKAIAGGQGPSTGKLHYQKLKAKDATPTLIPVKVSGKLNAKTTNGGGDLTGIMCDVSGEQVFDTARRVWVSGALDIKLSSLGASDNKIALDISGSMKVTMTEITAPAAPAK